MTYKELQTILSTLTDEQLEQDVTVYDARCEEFFPVGEFINRVVTQWTAHDPADGVLDDDHVYLVFGE